MILWIDTQLSPHLAPWVTRHLGVEARSASWLGYRDATDQVIFSAAKKANAIVLTKDRDFPDLLDRYGPPPSVIWVTIGNTTNAHMKEVLSRLLPLALDLIGQGETLVELSDIGDKPPTFSIK